MATGTRGNSEDTRVTPLVRDRCDDVAAVFICGQKSTAKGRVLYHILCMLSSFFQLIAAKFWGSITRALCAHQFQVDLLLTTSSSKKCWQTLKICYHIIEGVLLLLFILYYIIPLYYTMPCGLNPHIFWKDLMWFLLNSSEKYPIIYM